jgi:flagellar hook protein FlgE
MSSLFTALSGLQAHQDWMDVIGNNLANSSTPGYKSSRASFSDYFSRTLQFASGPGTNLGGRNPVQIGNGVRLADIGRNFAQGPLSTTGRTFDLALEGQGFFTLQGGSSNLYTRVGTFGLDALHNLVDARTGLRVIGADGQPVTVDTDTLFPPAATQSMTFKGNLPAVVTGPLREVLEGQNALTQGSPAVVAGTATGPFTVPVGQTLTLQLQIGGTAPQTASVTSSTGTVTAADIAAAIDGLNGVSAAVNGSGVVEVTTDRKGNAASIKISSGPSGQDLAALAGLPTTLVTGSETAVTATTTLNDLPGNTVPYAPGDVIQVSGVDNDGQPINATFTYGAANDGETVDDFIAFLDGLYSDATVTLQPDGTIRLEALTAGESGLNLSLLDGAGSTGQTSWSTYALSVTTEGTGPDVVTTSMEVFDQAGVAHAMTFAMERQEDGTWTVTPTVPASEGSVQSGPITGLTFAADGTPIGLNNLTRDVAVAFNGQPTQTVTLDFGQDGMFDGVTQYGGEGSVFVAEQDGYGVGELSSLDVDSQGVIEGFYTNGQMQDLGQLGISVFGNPEGLRHVGNNMFAQTTNSGALRFGPGATGAAGSVVGGALESSNVDTAEQFVNLIEAQRGFQANARVIKTQDEILNEMVNLV